MNPKIAESSENLTILGPVFRRSLLSEYETISALPEYWTGVNDQNTGLDQYSDLSVHLKKIKIMRALCHLPVNSVNCWLAT